MEQLDKILINTIDNKYIELGLDKVDENCKFWKIRNFEGNAIGQIGEEFVKKIFEVYNLPNENKKAIIHDEYDILSNGKKIEIKTARKGIKNHTFQFNGINPIYNYDMVILIGITYSGVFYTIISDRIIYEHNKRKYYINFGGRKKQLVSMNPGNTVNYKLTLSLKDLKPIDTFVEEISELLQK